MLRIGFIGLGAMGKPMAANLLAAGYKVTVNDVVAAAVAEMVAKGAAEAATAKELAAGSDVVITMLPNAAIVEAVVEVDEERRARLQLCNASCHCGLRVGDMVQDAEGIAEILASVRQRDGVNPGEVWNGVFLTL